MYIFRRKVTKCTEAHTRSRPRNVPFWRRMNDIAIAYFTIYSTCRWPVSTHMCGTTVCYV